MRYSPLRERSLYCFVDYVYYVSGPHHSLVERSYVHEDLVEIHILLVMGADQIVERMPGNRQNRLPITLGIVQTVEQMNPTRSGCCDTHSQAACKFRIPASSERCGLFVSNLNETKLIFVRAESPENSVHAIAGEAENDLDAPCY